MKVFLHLKKIIGKILQNVSTFISIHFLGFQSSVSYRLLVVGTIVNLVVLPFHGDFSYLLIRQILVLLGSIIHFKFLPFIKDLFDEQDRINFLLCKQKSYFKYDKTVLVLGYSCYILILYSPMIGPQFTYLLFFFPAISLIFCLFFTANKFYIIVSVPELKYYFNIKESILKTGLLSLDTFSKFYHVFLFFFRVVGIFLLACFLGPKLVVGDLDFRGVLWNDITFHYTRYRSSSARLCTKINYLIEYEGYTILTILTNPETGYVEEYLVEKVFNQLFNEDNSKN